ncbi:replication factor-A carboxy-terminal domain protein [Medicago truncatula]|uniref:Replication factor-A carboxy-terminal domain protein n=1 Tax=Medicago truncatula TaxID=3880 RepID=A0A072UHN1_MEDTR|nr:replication factor-A carboxy-terminal domain protein [Medicago truncatula]
MSGSLIVPLADDMMNTKNMTIEDLIESTDLGNVIVFASICGIEPEYGWYYDACTKCAGRITIVAGRMFCPRCKQSRNAVPRFKLHVQVMDTTGSTSFILFDRNVSNYVGRSVQDLIDAQGQGDNSLGYPADLEVLVGKKMLFKVDITNGNLLHNWRNYGVKRTSDDAELIQMFIKKHNVKVIEDDDEAAAIDVHVTQEAALAKEVPTIEGGDSNMIKSLEGPAIEGDDSNKSLVNQQDGELTPCSKVGGKRSADQDVSDVAIVAEVGERSINKPVKLKSVKIEKNP